MKLTKMFRQFRRIQEHSFVIFVDFRNPVSLITGTQFRQLRRLQATNLVDFRKPVLFRQFRFVDYSIPVSSASFRQFRFISEVS